MRLTEVIRDTGLGRSSIYKLNRHRFARHLSAIQNGGRRTDNLLRINVALYVVQAQLARISIETPKRHEKARTRRALACSERGGGIKFMIKSIGLLFWVASRASSVSGCRFSILQGKLIIERSRLNRLDETPNHHPNY
ncbi:hypothetical protein [Alcanivorax sp.]|uniref:hypothetical protein n=1 Tax=Alcanivorax sp. TaxID=1872427 RepID=UPI00339C5429